MQDATPTFGRRGLKATLPPLAPSGPDRTRQRSSPLIDRGAMSSAEEPASVFERIPILTILLALGFFAGFAIQQRVAFHHEANGKFDLASLVAMGAVSYDLVFVKGEWWRIFVAPLLHNGFEHQLGNTVALCFAGYRLERMVGRFWFLAIFCLSALGGVAGSLLGNPHAVVTVGASGGITGLLGALFVASFHHKADELSDQAAMRRTALRFGVPALIPLLFNAHDGVDYSAHAAGAATGAALACLICLFWPGNARRPHGSFVILLVPAAYFSLSMIGIGYAARDFAAHRDHPADSHPAYMSDRDLPKAFKLSDTESAELVEQFPLDPRAHLLRGVSLASASRFGAAEYELRAALDRFKPDDGLPGHDLTVALLAFDLAAEGRKIDAHEMAVPLCAVKDQPKEIETLLTQSHVCDPVKP